MRSPEVASVAHVDGDLVRCGLGRHFEVNLRGLRVSLDSHSDHGRRGAGRDGGDARHAVAMEVVGGSDTDRAAWKMQNAVELRKLSEAEAPREGQKGADELEDRDSP